MSTDNTHHDMSTDNTHHDMSTDNTHHEQGGCDVSPPPPYHQVVGRSPSPPRGDLKSEKATLGDSQEPVAVRAPRRRRLLRRVWERLTCSRRLQESLPATKPRGPEPHAAASKRQEPSPPAAPEESRSEAERWKKAESTIQRGRNVRFVQSKYLIIQQHAPMQRLSEADVGAAPWVAALSLRGDDLEGTVLQHVPWIEKLDQCWSDQITVVDHILDKSQLIYARKIMLAYKPAQGHGWEWTASATILHRDANWLSRLTYSEVGDLFRYETMFRAAAFLYPHCDPLEHPVMFYKVYPKPVADDKRWQSRIRSDERVKADEPELRQLVCKYFERRIPGLHDYSERTESSKKLAVVPQSEES